MKKEKKSNKEKKLCRLIVPNFFGDVSGNKEHFFTPYDPRSYTGQLGVPRGLIDMKSILI